jgi:hypothetical protein
MKSKNILTVMKIHRLLFCVVFLCIYFFGASESAIPMKDPVHEAKLDSLIQVYLGMGVPVDLAEQRASIVLRSQYNNQSPTGITTRQGEAALPPNPGSIHVNRDIAKSNYTPQQLVENIFVKGGSCSSVSNVTLTSHGWNGTNWTHADSRGLGYFERGTSNFEMEEGLVLSTGGLASIEGDNSFESAVAGPINYTNLVDPDLQSLISEDIKNVSALEFDFMPIGNVMSFRYVFASEEYLYFVHTSFNDVFGFFISGPGISGNQNIATLPTTNSGDTVVSINNVNWGFLSFASHNCATPIGPGSGIMNEDYYINIPFTDNEHLICYQPLPDTYEDSLRLSMEFNGRTVVLTATCQVIPCQTYHLKLAVGNAGDNAYQSGVFLEGHSFSIGDNIVNWGSMNEGQDFGYRGCPDNMLEFIRTSSNYGTDEVLNVIYTGSEVGNITQLDGTPLPSVVTIPAYSDTVRVHYKVNLGNTGHGTFIVTVPCPCGGYYDKTIDIYDKSDPLDFQIFATPVCPGSADGTLTVSTGVGGNGIYECSINEGLTWETAPMTYTDLTAGNYNVYIRDEGSCDTIFRTASTYMPSTISGSPDLCPPTNTTTLLSTGISGPGPYYYQWYKDGIAIFGATSASYLATAVGDYSVAFSCDGVTYSDYGDTISVGSDRCVVAFEDTNLIPECKTLEIIDVLANDLLGLCDNTDILVSIVTPPTRGSASVGSDNKLTYNLLPGFTGRDSLTYKIACESNVSYAKVYLYITECPDNIIDPDCFEDPPATPFSFNLLASSPSSANVSHLAVPLLGDIDNDGQVEIVVPATHASNVTSNVMRIFQMTGNTMTLQQSLSILTFYVVANSYTIANVDGGPYASLFVASSTIGNATANQRILVKYSFNGTQYVESARSTVPYSAIASKENAQPMIADFNGDGIPEIVLYDKVYNARTLALLADGNYLSNPAMGFGYGAHSNNNYLTESASIMAVADMDGDGIPEVIGGDCVYKVDITNPNGTAGNSFTLWNRCNKLDPNATTHNEVADGATSVADMDGDGYLDVIVTVTERKNPSSSNGAVYIWNPRTGRVLHTDVINNIPPATSFYGPSVAFIGDLNGDGQPDICLVGSSTMRAYQYNPASKRLTQMWSKGTNDVTGSTTMSMFDFNQDGKTELVYRDETHLRIINGTDGTDLITPVSCTSSTGIEYPIVADVNSDGSAEIIVTGGASVYVYGSNPVGLWAPARKVWNQYAYNVVNVNEDLTIPKYQMNPSTLFPGKDGIYGTPDDVHPFNNYLQQQTTLNTNGVPVWLMPDVYTMPAVVSCQFFGDSISIKVGIINQGDAAIGSPVYVSAYKETSPQVYNNTNRIAIDSANIMIIPGDTSYVYVRIPHITPFLPLGNVILRLNDNGGALFPYQAECDSANNYLTFNPQSAEDDYVQLLACYGNPQTIDALQNDVIIDCNRNSLSLAVTSGPKVPGATATVNPGKNIVYTYPVNFLGHDTLEYTITCNSKTYSSKVYIVVKECPENIIVPTCFGDPVPQNWSMEESYSNEINLSPYQGVVTGDIDGDGIVEIIIAADPVDGNVNISGLGSINRPANKIAIYKGNNIKSPPFVFNTKQVFTWDNKTRYGIVKTKIAAKDTTLIVVAEADRRLRAYNYNGVMVWESPSANPYHASLYNGMSPTFADLNHDGIPEIAIGGRLFNSTDGSFICAIPAGHPALSYSSSTNYRFQASAVVQLVDVFDNGNINYVMGNYIYDVNINPGTNVIQSLTLNKIITPPTGWTLDPDYVNTAPANIQGGAVLFVDMDKDGKLDMVVSVVSSVTNHTVLYIADPATGNIKAAKYISNASYAGYPFVGDVDGDGNPEIALIKGISGTTSTYQIVCYKYVPNNPVLQLFWQLSHTDGSCVTGLTLFDFDQDKQAEIVYRDESALRIIDGRATSPYPNRNKTSMPNYSGTGAEYPVVADVDGDGQAEIIIVGAENSSSNTLGRLRVYKSANPSSSPWSPARKVWNQYAYHPLYVNDDLSIPAYQVNPATVFSGADGILGTSDDVRPFNNFLQQQTTLNHNGVPFWLLPDVYTTPAVVSSEVFGDSISIKVGIINQGDAAIGSPVYVSVYKETSPMVYNNTNRIAVDSANIMIIPGETGYVYVRIPDITPFLPMGNIIIRLNDNGIVFTYQAECDSSNNMLSIVNPVYDRLMHKDATLMLSPLPFSHNGTYPNPVATLYGEEIEYRLSLVNKFFTSETIEIRDTLPAYLEYLSASMTPATPPATTGTPPRYALAWIFPGVAPNDSAVITFRTKLQDGVSASQPMFINKAYMTIRGYSGYTNSTYHQGAGITIVTFSAGYGGHIYNASEQALDYGTSPRSGVVVVPDEGFRFAGWSHTPYSSLRGETIAAQSGVPYYETLTVYGDVTLQANFEPDTTPVVLQLDEIENARATPPANEITTDRIWAAAGELYVNTSKPGSIVRIYSMEGLLLKLQPILKSGETKIKMPSGLYVVTLNNSLGTKIRID